jgi:hypothetical protein
MTFGPDDKLVLTNLSGADRVADFGHRLARVGDHGRLEVADRFDAVFDGVERLLARIFVGRERIAFLGDSFAE